MMFRNTRREEEEEESGSDWDDSTPQTTPQRKQQQSPPHTQPHKQPRSFLGSDVPAPTTAEPHFTSLSTSSPHPPPPSTPAAINPVYKVSHDEGTQTNVGVPTPPHVHTSPPHSHTSLDQDGRESRVPNSESGVFRFHAVSELAAQQLLSVKEPTHSTMGEVASRSEQLSQRCAVEVFSALRVCTDCLIVFFLECLRYVTFHLLHKLCCGIAVVLSDSLLKPSLTDCFNALLWPLSSCLWQTGRSLRFCLGPCLELLAALVSQCALLLRACRLVEINKRKPPSQQQQTV